MRICERHSSSNPVLRSDEKRTVSLIPFFFCRSTSVLRRFEVSVSLRSAQYRGPPDLVRPVLRLFLVEVISTSAHVPEVRSLACRLGRRLTVSTGDQRPVLRLFLVEVISTSAHAPEVRSRLRFTAVRPEPKRRRLIVLRRFITFLFHFYRQSITIDPVFIYLYLCRRQNHTVLYPFHFIAFQFR